MSAQQWRISLTQSIICIHLSWNLHWTVRRSIWSINERWIRCSSHDLRFACQEKRWINQIANAFDVRPDCKVFRGIDRKSSSIIDPKIARLYRTVRTTQCINGIPEIVFDAPFLLVDCISVKIAIHWKMMWCYNETQCAEKFYFSCLTED